MTNQPTVTSIHPTSDFVLRASNAARERDEREAKAWKCWKALDALRPEGAYALIVAEYEEDESDGQSDYYGSRTTRRVAIGWRTTKRESFKQLHAAAANYAPTMHLGDKKYTDERGRCHETEHRENYSMGHGNYLAVDRYSGWQVRSLGLDYAGYRDTPYILWLPGLKRRVR